MYELSMGERVGTIFLDFVSGFNGTILLVAVNVLDDIEAPMVAWSV